MYAARSIRRRVGESLSMYRPNSQREMREMRRSSDSDDHERG
ncbi:hypothetical protein VB773_11630 [Haloarculaceae archaeon H-GB2-1]|nr:hypothetical protein [Haloarculaceae archaeon H-GB2-1]